jgi:hypothetical protein
MGYTGWRRWEFSSVTTSSNVAFLVVGWSSWLLFMSQDFTVFPIQAIKVTRLALMDVDDVIAMCPVDYAEYSTTINTCESSLYFQKVEDVRSLCRRRMTSPHSAPIETESRLQVCNEPHMNDPDHRTPWKRNFMPCDGWTFFSISDGTLENDCRNSAPRNVFTWTFPASIHFGSWEIPVCVTNNYITKLDLTSSKAKAYIPYLRVYKQHFFDKNLPSKIGVRQKHGILRPFDDWLRDADIVCCETPTRDR